MKTSRLLSKILVLFVLAVAFVPVVSYGYSYWNDLSDTKTGNISIGSWMTNAITTPQEFYDFATKSDSLSTDSYYLANDLDFTGFSWAITSSNFDVTFRGTLDGNGYTISNLTISTNSSYYSYLGIFPRMEGGTITDLTLDNVNLVLDSTALANSSTMSGLITADVYGSTNTIENITMIDCGVRGTSSSGVGGLVGSISNSSASLSLSNISATGVKVFNLNSYSGGLVGNVAVSGATLDAADLDLTIEVSSMSTNAYVGGVVGGISSGSTFTLNRAIVEMTTRNTLETSGTYFNSPSGKYLGGFVGVNQSTSNLVSMTDAFFTGTMYTDTSKPRFYVGTAIGTSTGSQTMNAVYYSDVLFVDDSRGTSTTSPKTDFTAVDGTIVSATQMPTVSWWNSFAVSFDSANSLWTQNVSTGRLELIR